jgi:hypothetical protein
MREPPNCGRHSMIREASGLLVLTLDGDISLDDVNKVIDEEMRLIAGMRHVFLLIDFTKAGALGPDARRRGVEGGKDIPYSGIALFGASFQTRVVANMMISAAGLFSNRPIPTTFTKTEAEARAWLEERQRAMIGR